MPLYVKKLFQSHLTIRQEPSNLPTDMSSYLFAPSHSGGPLLTVPFAASLPFSVIPSGLWSTIQHSFHKAKHSNRQDDLLFISWITVPHYRLTGLLIYSYLPSTHPLRAYGMQQDNRDNASTPALLIHLWKPPSIIWCHRSATWARLTPSMPGSIDKKQECCRSRVALQSLTMISNW